MSLTYTLRRIMKYKKQPLGKVESATVDNIPAICWQQRVLLHRRPNAEGGFDDF